MTEATLDILGIGNAIVDVLARAGDDFISNRGLAKGGMTLIDADQAQSLYAAMGPGVESSGGSVANSCAVASGLGARVGYLGKVAKDTLGDVFAHDIRATGVHFPTAPLVGGAPTARCLILVTPDAQRTMSTYLGACIAFGEADVDMAEVARAQVVYLEGYLFSGAQDAFRAAARTARAAGRKVALSLSDGFCVDMNRDAFRRFVREETDILFANEAEILSLYETSDFAAAAAQAGTEVSVAALTRSERGSVIVAGAASHDVPAQPTTVVDTTGAGDAYAAGFLAAHTRGLGLPEAGRWGSICAAEVISHFGARPQADLRALVGG